MIPTTLPRPSSEAPRRRATRVRRANGFRDTRASQTFRISLETRASVDYILFASLFALALFVARCNCRRTLARARARGSTRKRTPRMMTERTEPSRSFRDAMPSPRDAPPTVRARPNSNAHGDTFVVVVDERARASRRRAGRRVARQEDRRVASIRGADHRDSRGDDARGRRARAETTGEGARARTHNFRARCRRLVGGLRASREGGGRSEWETSARGWFFESTNS